jgi:hypothetical protein
MHFSFGGFGGFGGLFMKKPANYEDFTKLLL